MKAITTKYFGPTNTRGSRIKVNAWYGSKTFDWDYSAGTEDNHIAAAYNYVEFLNNERHDCSTFWAVVSSGSLPKGEGYAFIIELH